MIQLVAERFALLFTDTPAFMALVEKGLAFMHVEHAPEKLALVAQNFFSEELFQAMVCGGSSYKTGPINFLWQRLEVHRLAVRSLGHSPRAFVSHVLDTPMLWEHLRGKTFPNLFAPPAGLADRYAGAIVAIDVEKKGSSYRGSGFIAQASHDTMPWIVTCRHNIDAAEGIVLTGITTAGGQALTAHPPIISDEHDLAILRPRDDPVEPIFQLSDSVTMFDEVFTLGFPNLPGAFPVLTGHRGEVNAVTDLYLEKSPVILMSNLVAPGSSGCPVLLADGRCIGITTKWLEGETSDGEKSRFSAALPAGPIRALLTARRLP
ncbi:MAG: Trypsin-like peptidase domain [Sphingomonadales bacterium]|jgi:S1-C subfamily serine protease|nr:Trypsin-like peptidase domain [Sphingomonadales bacterium]